MGLTPGPDPGHIIRVTEVVAVLRFGEPSTLAGLLARPLAVGGMTEVLTTPVPVVAEEQLVAVQAFALRAGAGHNWEEDGKALRSSPSYSPCETTDAEEDGRRVQDRSSKKTAREEDRIFKPAS
jgi:hypothetical protein